VVVQVDDGSDARGVGSKSDARAAAVDVQSSDDLRDEGLHQFEVRRTDASRLVQHEHDIDRAFDRLNCDKNKQPCSEYIRSP